MPPPARPTLYNNIPQGARYPDVPSPIDSWTPYLQASDSSHDYQSYRPYAASSTSGLPVPERMHGRTASLTSPEPSATPYAEPPLARSISYASSLLHGKRRSSTASTTSSLSRRESLDYMLEVCASFLNLFVDEPLAQISYRLQARNARTYARPA